jgi:hypothetical protein
VIKTSKLSGFRLTDTNPRPSTTFVAPRSGSDYRFADERSRMSALHVSFKQPFFKNTKTGIFNNILMVECGKNFNPSYNENSRVKFIDIIEIR